MHFSIHQTKKLKNHLFRPKNTGRIFSLLSSLQYQFSYFRVYVCMCVSLLLLLSWLATLHTRSPTVNISHEPNLFLPLDKVEGTHTTPHHTTPHHTTPPPHVNPSTTLTNQNISCRRHSVCVCVSLPHPHHSFTDSSNTVYQHHTTPHHTIQHTGAWFTPHHHQKEL